MPIVIPLFLSAWYRTLLSAPNETKDREYSRPDITPFQVSQELQKLETIMDQLKAMGHAANFELPNFHKVRMRIDRLYSQRGPDADLQQCISDGCLKASVSQLRLLNRSREQVPPDFTLGTDSSVNFFDLNIEEQASQSVRYILIPWMHNRLHQTYFKARNTLGTGQPSVRGGDEIWFLHGAFSPVVLRRLPTGNYRFMGEAYVHGVMYGEAGAECVTHERITIV